MRGAVGTVVYGSGSSSGVQTFLEILNSLLLPIGWEARFSPVPDSGSCAS